MTEFRRVALNTGVTLNVSLAGNPARQPVVLLHGFPESHRTWRELAPLLEKQFFLVMPDQRGFAASDLPQDLGAYKTDMLIEDVFALANALRLDTFALVGHDWGGAIAWGAALAGNSRISRLAIINAPHPVIFQKSLIDDEQQRAASQYISAFRTPGFAQMVAAKGFDWFFETIFGQAADLSQIPEAERRQYIADWSQPGALNAMLNWYRASSVIVPPPGLTVPLPEWLLRAFPKVRIPTLVLWGMKDRALLPVQLDGLERLVDQLELVRIEDAGHFAPWEAPREIAARLQPFLAAHAKASARDQ